jgi:hypothetical protein
MHHRLTLRVSDEALKAGKDWSARSGRSLSRLIEEVFLALSRRRGDDDALPPITRELAGMAAGVGLDEQDYKRHLEEKYL